MAADDADLWQTLARIYAAVLACALVVPSIGVLPTVFGIRSVFATLSFGFIGLAGAGVLYVLLDAQVERVFIARRPNRQADET